MYLGIIPHVSLMYPRTTADTFIPHVSLINLACIMYVSCMFACILEPLQIHVSRTGSRMYHECILYVSWLYLEVSSWPVQDTCIVMKRPRYMYPDVSWHVSSVTSRKRIRYMYYLDVSDVYPKCILVGLVWDTCKIHVKYQDTCTCILLECNRAFKIHLRYIKIHPGYMYSTGYTHDTSRYNS